MKKLTLLLLANALVLNLLAHEHGHGDSAKLWELKNEEEFIRADFLKEEKGLVYLIDGQHQLLEFELTEFTEEDQRYILEKSGWIKKANLAPEDSFLSYFTRFSNWLIPISLALILIPVFRFEKTSRIVRLASGTVGIALVFIACKGSNNNSSINSNVEVPANDLSFLNSVFGAFSGVSTRSDERYFYVASDGLPAHEMMTGITNWQQQVPIPHDYSGANSWAIPVQPALAARPLSTQENFMKGAIAVAANGIPIFNPLNNRGEDAKAIGELDHWGGHCGRADDYHYHLPPTHLQEKVGAGKPIAYALDGFPVYGETTLTLDENLGRFDADGSYRYHAVREYPYLIAAMRGKVSINPRTSAPENEISPQAKTKGVRPALRPLKGAAITDFEKIQANQYRLTYTLRGQNHTINYGWDESGRYSFEFVNPDGTSSTFDYQRD